MTGRGDGRLFRPSPNAAVRIGLTLSTSSPTLDSSLSTPFSLVLTARILTTPRPDSPIVLATFQNPFGSISNRSFGNIICISPTPENGKRIEIWPRGWPHYVCFSEDLREDWSFVTIHPDRPLDVRHEVDKELIAAAGVRPGEKYQAALTDKCLGTRWWMFGSLDEAEGTRFKLWMSDKEKEKKKKQDEEDKYYGDEEKEEEGEDKHGSWTMGENPKELALVIEKGEVEFEIS